MGLTLVLHFANGELVLDRYTSLDISRSGAHDININATNTNGDLTFNELYERIKGLLGDDDCFSATIVNGEDRATFDNLAANYYLNATSEMLHFGRRQAKAEQ